MAKTKSTSSTKRVTIPRADRKGVAKYKRLAMLAYGKPISDEQAHRQLLAQRKHTAAMEKQTAAELVKKQAADKLALRERAIDELFPALHKLAAVRDLLQSVEDGETGGHHAETFAMFARLVLTESGTQIEDSLARLGLIQGDEVCGHFLEDLPKSIDAQPAA